MKPACIEAVNAAAAAIGRKALSAAEIRAIDDRLARTMRYLAGTDEKWQSKSADRRVMEASTFAMKEIQREAARKLANAQLQIVKTAAVEQRIKAVQAHTSTRSAALVHVIDRAGDYVSGVKQESMGHLMALIDAVKSGSGAGIGRRVAMFLFDVQNPGMTRDLAREVFSKADGSTGNAIARAGAKAWLETIEGMRQRFNAAGGDVGKLLYGYLPTPHDAVRIRAAGRDAWIDAVMPLLDRPRYTNEAGVRLDDAQLREVLRDVWTSIATEGEADKVLGIERQPGVHANRGLEHRELHFKDAPAYLGYLQNFGKGSMYDAMLAHVGGMARNIGLVEQFGPNPNAQMRLQFDLAGREDRTSSTNLPRSLGLRPQSYWDYLNGTASTVGSARLAQIGSDVRNVMTAGKLASAVIASVTDLGTYAVTTHFNKLSYWDAIANIGKLATSRDARQWLTVHGIIAESMAGDLNRWTNDNIKATWSSRMAQSVLRLSLMNAWTDTLRRAFSLTMMQGMARLAGHNWEALGEWDRSHLERKGITPEDWSVIRRSELTEFQGMQHLTPESIRSTGDARADEVVAKYLGLIQDESEYAVLNPDLATKVLVTGGSAQRGTVKGELARSVMQFKSFPVAMISRHWNRMLEMPKVTDGSAPGGFNGPPLANRLLYAGGILASTTMLGMIAYQAKQVLAGKDPADMTGPHAAKVWGKAVAQGGGLSIVGDMLLNDPGQSVAGFAGSTLGTIAGPGISTVMQAAGIPLVNAWDKAKGKRTHTAAEELQLVRSNLPYVNLWYAKAAIDHAGMQALQENLSPGYLGRMRQNAQKDWGQQYWWVPGSNAPQRAPNLGAAVGQP